ncbi:DUF3500 domain-containing protein [Roseimaritima sediminicola]|uniref:DUF3500 domain-containing protein n=1 Tax=Roseimaritima sediminicola TaxID=2662066 RepID=UPI0012982A1C|nr:DUF3500 domain-containing protein [Roseimaritima sediminicola]
MTIRPTRREFLGSSAALTAAAAAPARSRAAEANPTSESLTRVLYDSLSPKQREEVCFAWDHQDPRRGLLRSFVANNWNVTKHELVSDFYTDDQQQLVRDIFESIIAPEWHDRYDQQLEDDAGGFGNDQSLAIFGNPHEDKFELVLTGRHMTLRCDGNSADHVAFGGPIFYGHAADGFNEGKDHIDNVFWPQAVAANGLYKMLDGKQRKLALRPKTPREQSVAFRGPEADLPGLPGSEMSADQKEHLQRVLQMMLEMYRDSDRSEALSCIKAQGGLDACHLAFYSDHDIGGDEVWDNWRLEGPSFVWHFRGSPHVHVWVNLADSPDVPLNA